jgi:hypothetical protein
VLFEHFEAQRSLPGDHRLIIEGMNERQAELLRAANVLFGLFFVF